MGFSEFISGKFKDTPVSAETYIKQVTEENEKSAILTRFAIIFNDLTKTSHFFRNPGVRFLASSRSLTAFHWLSIAAKEKQREF